ncbi:MAG: DUF4384 domain-containing protein [Candidatus Zixiibacteriota bacterium]|nr:MAG: DUF4384 domain-containing protein [candidate division Zixibacteria bacterium]
MTRSIKKILGLTALMAVILPPVSMALDTEEFDQNFYDRIKIDRYLDVEIWTNHSDNEFYEGDNIVLNFRANQDAFVAIYSIDSRGRVNLLFPMVEDGDNFVQGGVNYRLPDGGDDFDLVVTGPEGVENIQIIASRDRFPIPDWYPTSGLECDWDDRLDFMDYLNNHYFVRYDGQRFAFDRTSIYINEWEPSYFRPIYYPYYPSWTVCGNAYIDYPWGATVYINGIYWGITPLYIPHIYVGWHTFTIYDEFGYCWEHPVHITRYNTVVLDRTIVVTSSTVVSKYKDVRVIGYRDPVLHGYPSFKTKKVLTTTKPGVASKKSTKVAVDTDKLAKKYVRGSGKLVKGDRGFETVGLPSKTMVKGKADNVSGSSKGRSSTITKSGSSGKSDSGGSSSARYKSSGRSSTSGKSSSGSKATKQGSSGKSSGYYQKKSGSSGWDKASKSGKSSSSKSSKSTIKKRSSAPKAQPSSRGKSSSSGKSSKGSSSSSKKSSSSDKGKSSSSKSKTKTKP